MKTNLSKLCRILLGSLFMILITGKAFSQTNTYNIYIKNITYVDCKNLDLEIWLEWTGTNTQKFQFFQAGINFNYAGLANGGTLTGAFQAGSADASLPAVQQVPNWNLNASSKQIRMLSAIATPSSIAATTPPPPGFRLGRFRITNTVDFATGATPNFVWSFAVGTSTTTQTKVSFYLGGATTGTDVTVQSTHFVESNPAFNQTCGIVCQVTATVDQNTAPLCLGGNNGSARVTLSGQGTTSTGSYSVDGGASVNYTTNPFVINGLTSGNHTVTVITATPCTTSAVPFSIGAGTNPDDGNPCTVDACNSANGQVTNNPIPTDDGNACTTDGCNTSTGVFHTPVNTDDGNACTTDACNSTTGSVTHVPVNTDDGNPCTTDACNSTNGQITHVEQFTDDGNACTTDACNSTNGQISHTPVNTDDNNPCTTDGCNSLTGVFHNPVNVDDGNACTTDGCNTSTGVFHTPVNTDDGNACTTDGCNSTTGVFHTPVQTDDGNACTTDACNSTTGVVTHVQVSVEDNNPCTTDGCNSLTGVFHTPVNINDQNACTTDGCNTSTGVFHTPVNTDDGNACTTDACNSTTGQITNTPVNTDDGNICTQDICNTATGAITHPPVSVDDGNACTTDACTTPNGVTHTPVNTDDGNACTTDGCNSITGVFHNPVSTTDNNACTTDNCNSVTGQVTHTPVSTDDGNACTTDLCNSSTGAITHLPVNTEDNNPCTVDGCNSTTGIFHTPVNVDDGNACTTDGCNSTSGIFHTPVNIDDNDNCTTDGCNTLTGVFHTQIPGCSNVCIIAPTANANGPYISCGATLLNGSVGGSATGGTWTTNGGGVFVPNAQQLNATYIPSPADLTNGSVTIILTSNNPAGAPCVPAVSQTSITFTSIDDGNACTTDACNSTTGQITHTPVSIFDGNACTTDACNPVTGQITHSVINPNDNNICTIDGCNTATGVFNIPVNVNDNNPCTVDGCTTDAGIFHTPVDVDDGNVCTLDACNTSTGQITHTDNTPVVTAVAGTIECYQGTTCVTVTATGGLAPYFGTGVFCGYGAGTYTFDVTDFRGCMGISSDLTLTEPSKINLFTASTPSDCSANTGTATANVTGGTPPYDYLWTPGGQTTNPATGLAGGVYSVQVTDDNGCTAVQPVVVGLTGVAPSPPVFTSGPAGACKKSTGLVYCVAPIPGVSTYQWTLPAGVTALGSTTGNCVTLKFSSKFKGGFICVKGNGPCGTSTLSCKNVVLIKKKPSVPGNINGPISICPSSTGTYSIAPVIQADGYIWSGNHGIQIISGQGTTTVVISTPANFTNGDLKVRATNCKGKSGDRVLKLITTPDKPGGISGQNNVCRNSDQSYSINPVLGAASYLWSATNGVVVISGQGSTNVVLRFNGATHNKTKISVIAQNACGSSDDKTKDVDINLNCRVQSDMISDKTDNGIPNLSSVSAYPNPTTGRFMLTFNSSQNVKYSVKVMEITGRVILNESIYGVTGYNSKEINLTNVSKGLYLVTLAGEGIEARTLRIIVE